MLFEELRKKLAGRSGQAGETLVETLVAMTVAGLSMIMLAMAIAVSSGIITRGATAAEAYYSGDSALVSATETGESVQVTRQASGATTIAVKYGQHEDLPGGGTAVSYEATELKPENG